MAAPDPSDPLRRFAKLDRRASVLVTGMLREALQDIDAMMRTLQDREGVGAIVRQTQLSAARVAILERLADLWVDLGRLIPSQAGEAALAAARANAQWDESLLRRMGLSAAERSAFQAGMERAAANAVQRAMNRAFDPTKTTNIPLSKRVYESSQFVNGLVDRRIQSALNRGLNYREFAKEIRGMVNPNTPGGASYAANRLARTEINNAFHYAQVENNKAKPWVKGMRWRLSGSHPKEDICDEMAKKNHANLGPGVYPKTEVPRKPHPHCLCTLIPEIMGEEEFLRRMQAGEFNQYGQQNIPGFGTNPPAG